MLYFAEAAILILWELEYLTGIKNYNYETKNMYLASYWQNLLFEKTSSGIIVSNLLQFL